MTPSAVVHPEPPRLVLGSTSSYRRELLARLRLPFEVLAPGVDETPAPGETPAALALRLARAKAEDVARRFEPGVDVVVIGSDQVADLEGRPLGKPHTHAAAVAQWRAMRGRRIVFHTAVAVLRPVRDHIGLDLVTVSVQAREVSDAEIEAYLHAEQPYDCAGSAKCEGLGIAMLDEIQSDDPTALVGLPLIATCRLLRAAGLDPLAALISPPLVPAGSR